MKTQVNEWKEIRAQGIVMIAFYVLVMSGILLISSGRTHESSNRLKETESGEYNEEAVPEVASPLNPAAVESEIFINNLYEALMPVDEPGIAVSDMMDIHFPDYIMEDIRPEFTENAFLKNVLEEKNNEVAAECALYWTLKDCLMKECEQSLKVENWMFDEAFWSHVNK